MGWGRISPRSYFVRPDPFERGIPPQRPRKNRVIRTIIRFY